MFLVLKIILEKIINPLHKQMDPNAILPAATADNSTAYYMSIVSGVCLAISEVLPYLSKVKGNGIIQAVVQYFNGRQEEEKRREEQLAQSVLTRLDTLIALLQQQQDARGQQ